ncbi:hypothetical protein, partial [Salmonella enterica]|uniref:hypothetical protein n=1 Tax=Salmonella enterica TaxID=28901 RepID=UPI001C301E01
FVGGFGWLLGFLFVILVGFVFFFFFYLVCVFGWFFLLLGLFWCLLGLVWVVWVCVCGGGGALYHEDQRK